MVSQIKEEADVQEVYRKKCIEILCMAVKNKKKKDIHK